MDITYKESDAFDSLATLSTELEKNKVDQLLSFKTDLSISITQLDGIISSYDQFEKEEKQIFEILVALKIDSFVSVLNIYNHISLSNLFLFAKNHTIEFEEDRVLTFYFSNANILSDEKSNSSLMIFVQLLQNNIDLIDQNRLIIIFNLLELPSFDIKNELIFIISDLYLIQKNIFNDSQTVILLEQIYIFCVHSQYQLLNVATNIINDNFTNEIIIEMTYSFIDDLKQLHYDLKNVSQYLNHFLQNEKVMNIYSFL
ncbi:hypothetical protein M9Y10_025133 [Tritrichomonas musculus]|uniref:Uncharacterized protein n=1 Tax=Tritrichomonas musculus TaxID=1915356 RepID=A0ABR2HCH5_9EUKA